MNSRMLREIALIGMLSGLVVYLLGRESQSPLQATLRDDVPFCEWSGDTVNGKPDGWGVGTCTFGREPNNKQHLETPLVRIDADTRPKRTDGFCDLSSPEECSCQAESWAASAASIDQYTTFRGVYSQGSRNGNGAYFYPDGRIYIGEWKNDLRHGRGTLFGGNCTVEYVGQWCREIKGACPSKRDV